MAPGLYRARLTIGTPPVVQDFDMAVDTGSGNLIVPSRSCTSEGCARHRRYNFTSGSGKEEITISFGQGLVSGFQAHDQVCLLGHRACVEMDFIAANFESQEPFGNAAYDGILGLALPQLAEAQDYSVLEQLRKSDLLRTSTFAIFLGYDGEESQITFGGTQPAYMNSALVWSKISDPGLWQVVLEGITIGSESLGVCRGASRNNSAPCQAVVDTGASYITGPSEVIEAIMNEVEIRADCSNSDSLPEIGFTLGGQTLALQPEDYVLQEHDACQLALMPLDIPPPRGPLVILGEPFLRRYYTIFDATNFRVGFSLARHSKRPTPIRTRHHRHLFPKLYKMLQKMGSHPNWRSQHHHRKHLRSALESLRKLTAASGSHE